MYIKKEDLTIVIVTYESERVVYNCIKSIDKEIKIIVIDNSNNLKFKHQLKKKFENVIYISSKRNIGMGAGNNLGIKNVKTKFAFILNPDVILKRNTIIELIKACNKIKKFGIMTPVSEDMKYPNYTLFDKEKLSLENPFRVKSIDGYSMLLNLKRLNKNDNFYFFDENFFLYLENNDLCRRLNEIDEKIYVVPKSKIRHLGGKAVNNKFKYEIELSRNWHWIWSKFYYNKKHYGYIYALISGLPTFFSGFIKFLFYKIIKKNIKKQIYLNRCLGYLNAVLGKKSNYRPNIKI